MRTSKNKNGLPLHTFANKVSNMHPKHLEVIAHMFAEVSKWCTHQAGLVKNESNQIVKHVEEMQTCVNHALRYVLEENYDIDTAVAHTMAQHPTTASHDEISTRVEHALQRHRKRILEHRNMRIVERLQMGYTLEEVAQEYALSKSQVQRISKS